MGEATYYLKARYKRPQEATQAAQDLTALVREGIEAHDWWQQHRSDPSREAFWSEFRTKFPLVTVYLEGCVDSLDKAVVLGGDHNNGLAGHLDFGGIGDDENIGGEENTVVSFYALVWHFAEWDTLAAWLTKHTGAINVKWISDEYLEPFDSIEV